MTLAACAWFLLSLLLAAVSGAEPRVELMYVLVCFFGLVGIALFVRRARDVYDKLIPLVIWFMITMLVFDLLSAWLIVKRQPFSGWYAIYPAGIGLFLVVAVGYGYVLNIMGSKGGKK